MNSPKLTILSATFIVYLTISGCVEFNHTKSSNSQDEVNKTLEITSLELFEQSHELNKIQSILYAQDLLWLGTPKGL